MIGAARRDWLQQLRHYANKAAKVVQDLRKCCRFLLFNFCFILLQIGEPLNWQANLVAYKCCWRLRINLRNLPNALHSLKISRAHLQIYDLSLTPNPNSDPSEIAQHVTIAADSHIARDSNPFSASCSKLMLFEGSSAILV